MAISYKPWTATPHDYNGTAAFCSACLIDLNETGADKTQANCKLPVKEPGGDINVNALHAAAAVLAGARGGVKSVPAAAKRAAAKKLITYYQQANQDPPASLKRLAGS